ncbi:type III-D CRISPR-associated RAMP protein Csx10 [Calothrix sp. NIES-2098]|uniref:type III-D CRISPR-associated RAMP protein Csx10 n=1 Tax=Calothrix sp. NIES-2098 TaxID=1954171 RepID=UPI000B61F6AC|nr:hypothetical protein NIES2098_06180 [Calothrix sp. NIES-2098]
MKRIELNIKVRSPLALGTQKPGGSVNEVEEYIPGVVIRGAIASQILQKSHQQFANLEQNGGEFQTLFLGDRSAIFQNAYPAIAKDGDDYKFVTNEIQVLPATAVSSKTNPGFKPKHGVFDTLIDWFWSEQYHQPYDPSSVGALDEKTDARVETYSGFYSQENGKYYSHSASSRFLTRVGINRRRATSAEDILYSIAVLNESFPKNRKSSVVEWEDFVYRSYVVVEDDTLADKLATFINNNSQIFRLGGSISRGLGKVEIQAKPVKYIDDISTRINKFNQAIKNRLQDWQEAFGKLENNPLENKTYFTLDLQSDAILTEDWRRTTVISANMLKEIAGIDAEVDDNLKLHVAYSSYDYRSGWNAAWGLMKDVELVTNQGAVYLFSTTQPQPWLEALAKLEQRGIGDRTCEGYGQVQVCHEFHQVFWENAV